MQGTGLVFTPEFFQTARLPTPEFFQIARLWKLFVDFFQDIIETFWRNSSDNFRPVN